MLVVIIFIIMCFVIRFEYYNELRLVIILNVWNVLKYRFKFKFFVYDRVFIGF